MPLWNDTPEWGPTSSYVQPVVPPVALPDDAPEIFTCFNASWLPYILGALQQLCQPVAWTQGGGPVTPMQAVDAASRLLEKFGNENFPCGTLFYPEHVIIGNDIPSAMFCRISAAHHPLGTDWSRGLNNGALGVGLARGQFWLCEHGTNAIAFVDAEGVITQPELAGLADVQGMGTVGSQMWVCFGSASQVATYDLTGVRLGTLATSGMVLPVQVCQDQNGNGWVSSTKLGLAPDTMFNFSPAGALILSSSLAQFDQIWQACPVGASHLWITSSANNSIVVMDLSGAFVTSLTNVNLSSPQGICTIGGEVWVANGTADLVTRWDTSGSFLGTFGVVNMSAARTMLHVPAFP